MKVADAIRQATDRLGATSDTARLDAELLMAHALKASRSDMLLRHMSDPEPSDFAGLIDRRILHEPIAYIIGEGEFFGRSFTVNPAVLIPRGDSEAVVEMALESLSDTGRVLDMGTGSGALLLTLLAEKTGLTGVGVDASFDAVQVAALNARRLGVSDRARLVQSDWHEANWADELGQFDLIICNPPYVESGAVLDPDVRDFEPASALFAGNDGLDDYRTIIPQLGNLLRQTGVSILEIGRDQAESVAQIAAKSGFKTELQRDLAGRPRALRLFRQI